MRDISLPNGVVICDGPAIVSLKADGGDGREVAGVGGLAGVVVSAGDSDGGGELAAVDGVVG